MPTAMVTPDLDAVVSEIEIAAPPDRVFLALTTPAELQRWFNGSRECPAKTWHMDARLGGRYGFGAEKASFAINNVSEFECHGEIVEFDPPRRLAYTWLGNWHDDPAQETLVRWELTPVPGGTRVRVTHTGLLQMPVARQDYSGGWSGVLDMLKKFVET